MRLTPKTAMMQLPVSLICFDRYEYFSRVIESIKKNKINDRKIFIFHDKPIDGGANEGYLLIKDYCHSLVNSHPETFLYVENKFNLGIASQWFRAISFVIDFCGFPGVCILEDDLVLSEHYLEAIDHLFSMFQHDSRIGLFSCFNPIPRDDHSGYSMMGHDWGVCIGSEAWDQIRCLYLDYIKIQATRNYNIRDSQVIKKWIDSLGLIWRDGYEGSDSVLETLIAANRRARIVPNINLAIPIGEIGVHFTPEVFRGMFSNVKIDDLVDFRYPNDEEIKSATENVILSKEVYTTALNRCCDGQESICSGINIYSDYLLYFSDFFAEIRTSSVYCGKYDNHLPCGEDVVTLIYGPYIRLYAGRYFIIIDSDTSDKIELIVYSNKKI
ncbi:glycosyltransferase family 2 protein [Acidithiobacillus caldus]|uniref:glycosyltransferase family 2 protein n=1 Tax=Acidithiobacillus caldus TaxID=33059 RepID=UPI001C061894|nr:hypothetical protein [Acidithiobacillus caldus]MBU2730150.1 hypothetical protein [Acidithiobacillus caldus]MBU2734391.1 hypothetical protein [Acidithiobacillus caldus ATCC 51756]MBU2745064.1 hypothetical protein [Acidithiobacillus caldus]MBU2779392.1 hypothetical protein [Acidithiobacillus caldus]